MTGKVLLASAAATVLAMTAASAGKAQVSPRQVNLLIKGGDVFIGDLSPAEVQDVAITGDKVVLVGDAARAGIQAAKTIDATGKMVAPGFIDAHTHAAEDLTSEDRSKRLVLRQLTQGVTTNIIGVDGGGTPELKAMFAKATRDGVGTNFAAFVGFGAIRQQVLQNDDRAPNEAELASMKKLAAQGMCEGALGLSSGLFYAPQSFASTEEVIAVAKEAGMRGGLYDTHQRDEGTTSIGVVASTIEQIRIGRESGATLHLGHFKVSSGAKPNGESMRELIKLVEDARAAGQKITADQYPWSASNTSLLAIAIPRWAQNGGRAAMLKRFDNPDDLARIKREALSFYKERGGAQNILINVAREQPELVGRRVQEIADAWGVDAAEATIRILKRGGVSVAVFAITEPDIEALMVQPWTMTSSDGSDGGHPRGYASYPRLWTNYVVNKPVLTPAQFVHRSSGLVADTLGLANRGYLKPGYFADVVVIDRANYKPMADYLAPRVLSTGVVDVVVNGKMAIEGGKPTGVFAGLPLAKAPPAGSCS
jgi:N-acyl-D-amino-acid deacylase